MRRIIRIPPKSTGPVEGSHDAFIADVVSTFSTMQAEAAAAEISFRWRFAGHSKAQILEALGSPKLAAVLTRDQAGAVARGVAWLQEEHPHVPSRWDY